MPCPEFFFFTNTHLCKIVLKKCQITKLVICLDWIRTALPSTSLLVSCLCLGSRHQKASKTPGCCQMHIKRYQGGLL